MVRGPGCEESAEVQLVIVRRVGEKSLLELWVEQESKPGLPFAEGASASYLNLYGK